MTTIQHNGLVITCDDDAFADGTNEAIVYRAYGHDQDGKKYRVTWRVTPEWQAIEDEVRDLYRQGRDEEAHLVSCAVADESNACDWDNPDKVEVL